MLYHDQPLPLRANQPDVFQALSMSAERAEHLVGAIAATLDIQMRGASPINVVDLLNATDFNLESTAELVLAVLMATTYAIITSDTLSSLAD